MQKLIKPVRAGETSQTLNWDKVNSADGYVIYASKCNSGNTNYKLEEVADITSNTTTTWTHSGLERGTWYKYRIRSIKGVKFTDKNNKARS